MTTWLWIIGGIAAYFLLGKGALRLIAILKVVDDKIVIECKKSLAVLYRVNLDEVIKFGDLYNIFWPVTLAVIFIVVVCRIFWKYGSWIFHPIVWFFKFCWR